MIAAIYTNQSTHIWNHAAPPIEERNVPGWSHVWKRPRETAKRQSAFQIVLTISSRITFYRHDAPKPAQPNLTELKRDILAEAEAVLRQEEARQQAKQVELLAQAERMRLQKQAEEDEELVLAASILLRAERPVRWTVHQPRRSYARRSRR